MPEESGVKLLNMIEVLERLVPNMVDGARLNKISVDIMNNNVIYDSDRRYVEEMFQKLQEIKNKAEPNRVKEINPAEGRTSEPSSRPDKAWNDDSSEDAPRVAAKKSRARKIMAIFGMILVVIGGAGFLVPIINTEFGIFTIMDAAAACSSPLMLAMQQLGGEAVEIRAGCALIDSLEKATIFCLVAGIIVSILSTLKR